MGDKLQGGDWKKEKVHILKNKRDDEEQGVQPGGGKKNKKKGKNKEKKQETDTKLTLTIETLGYFDQIKVSPPTHGKDIEEVIEKLNEKKAYFVKVSDDLNDGKELDEDEKKVEKEMDASEEKK